MKKLQVAVFFGGQSSEHDISCLSAATVAEGLDPEKYELTLVGITRDGRWLKADDITALKDGSWRTSGVKAWLLPDAEEKALLLEAADGTVSKQKLDLAFPVLHGRYGEDGTIQGLFELAKLPYVGCGVVCSAVSMDKIVLKSLVHELGIAQAECVVVTKQELKNEPAAVRERIEKKLNYPLFVKPSDGGSSQGVSCVRSAAELLPALQAAAAEGTRVMAEEQIVGRELECAVMTTPEGTKAAGVGEILAADTFYSFDAKYSNPESRTETSPELPDGKKEEICRDAVRIFDAVCGSGLSRVDFFLEKDTNRVVFNEMNTLPGFTSISMYPMLWKAAGVSLREQMDRLVAAALRRNA